MDILSSELTSTAIATWFDDCTAGELMENELILYTPTSFKKTIIESRLVDSIKNALRSCWPRTCPSRSCVKIS